MTYIGHVVVPNRIVEHQLVIAQSPVVTYALFAVDYERINAEHLQSSGRG
jgi:hypothetical protein